MRLLDRYLLRELLLPFSFCLGGFVIIWTMANWGVNRDDFQEHGLRAVDILEYYAVKLPEFLVLLLPIAFLLAMLYALSQHARYNEITAIRAAGISMWRLGAPYFAVGLVASGILFVLNEFLAPDSEVYADQIMRRREGSKNPPDRNLIRQFGFKNDRDRRTWKVGTYDKTTSAMTDLEIIWTPADGLQRWLLAERASITDSGWVFYNVKEYRQPPGTNTLVPTLQTNMLAMPEFTETREAIRSEAKINSRLESVGRGRMKRPEVPVVEILEYLHFHPDLTGTSRNWIYTALYGRLAAPWKCLVVVLIALPFGGASGRRNVFVGVASSIFIVLTFHFFSEVCLALGTGGYLPAWLGGWAPNLLFGGVGIWLTTRVR